MKNGLPFSYVRYRALWSVVHVGFVSFILIGMAIWFIHDQQGVRLVVLIWTRLVSTQHSLSNSFRLP
jgi:uncharacterized integral membrane protein